MPEAAMKRAVPSAAMSSVTRYVVFGLSRMKGGPWTPSGMRMASARTLSAWAF